ncbi:MAG: radical SAM protein [Ruminococcus sp.]|jgi:radical SAM protein with 4Fe4S-binding SPASM domain|nr:radical SAM protein [Ruminococcus sp.]
MKYILNDGFALRGWRKLPFAVFTPNYGVKFLDKDSFIALSACDGEIDCDRLDEKYRNILKQAVKAGIIRAVGDNDSCTLSEWQKYRAFNSRYIKTAHWSITGACNYKCLHCYMSAPDAKYGQLSTEEVLNIADQIADCGIRNVSITGGEPLVRKDFRLILDRLISHGINITTVYSNGKLVTPELLDEFETLGIKPEFNMSFDGVGFHDWLRGVTGAEVAVNKAFALCKERGFPTGAELTLHQRNKRTLRESINHLVSLGVSHVKVNPAGLSGNWVKNHGADHLSTDECFEIYLEYIPQWYEDQMPMDIMLGGFFMGNKKSGEYIIPSQRYDGSEKNACKCICGHARLVMYIAADGRILPCMSLSGMDIQEKFPSLKDLPLSECITNSFYMDLITTQVDEFLKHNPDRCGKCEHKYICGGGCRASALTFAPDDIFAPDEAFCAIFKGEYIPRIIAAAKK